MQESEDVQEGFLCPLCMKDFGNQKLLQDHFISKHSSDEASQASNKGQNIIGIFDKAKRKILGKGDEILATDDLERNEEFQQTSRVIDFSYMEPQELGFTQDHTNEFRRVRGLTINDEMTQRNMILIRLEKILNALTDVAEPQSLNSSKKKAKEQSLVPWISDDEAKLCFSCKKTFSITKRKHHCRLCGQVICGKCSEFLQLNTDMILNVDDDEAKQKNALRICYRCLELLLRYYEIRQQKNKKIPLVQLYERITMLMTDADNLLPDFNKMAESISFGDSRYSYEHVLTTRLKLLKMYETMETLGKKVLALGKPTSTDEDPQMSTKTVGIGMSSQKLQRGICAYVTNYLTYNMFTLKAIPSKEEYVSLKEERDMLLKRQADREKAREKHVMKERAMMHQEILQKERNQQVSRDSSRTGGQPYDAEIEVIRQQMNNVEDFLKKAKENRRYDEVQSLEKNLNELQTAYHKCTLRKYGRS